MAPPRRIDHDALRRLHAEGKTGVEIAGILGVTPPAVHECCRRLGLVLPGPSNRYGGTTSRAIGQQRRAEQARQETAARRANRQQQRAEQARQETAARRASRDTKGERKAREVAARRAERERRREVVEALRREGLTLAAIGARLGITKERVRQILLT